MANRPRVAENDFVPHSADLFANVSLLKTKTLNWISSYTKSRILFLSSSFVPPSYPLCLVVALPYHSTTLEKIDECFVSGKEDDN